MAMSDMYIMEEDDMSIELDVEVVMDMDMVEVAVAVAVDVVISDMSIMMLFNRRSVVGAKGGKLCGQ